MNDAPKDDETPETGPVSFEYVPDLIESDNGFVFDQGKLAAFSHVLEHADPEDRDFAMQHLELDLRPRDDLLEVVVAADGRALGGFEAKLLLP
jgi:hypothetical protein